MPTTWLEWKCKASLLDNQWRRFQDMQPKATTNWMFSSHPPSSRLLLPHPPPLDPPPPLHPQSPNLWTWITPIQCRRDKNSVSSPPLEPCFDVPNNSPNHLLNSLLLCLEKLAKKSSNQTTHLFSCQNSL